MKKSNLPCGQKTLFQSWNKAAKRTGRENSCSLFQTWDTASVDTTEHASSSTEPREKQKAEKQKWEVKESIDDIITIGDEDEDDEFLAAVDQIDQNAKDSVDVGNLSFSACTTDVGSDIIRGFDCSSGDSWIYPTNYPIRDYQFNIVQKALFHNTLVTLPTGLGKTFIAAVVMYNFYRWYPQGKIVFMAPTKPLVAQQIEACYSIMGIPRQDTVEMTGNMAPVKREQLWGQKRVFFLTPQVFQNDLSRGSCRADDIVCLVFDEAHKALGNHSYCQVIREVWGCNKNFRVLALSATPGDGIKAVQQVVTNLLVSHIELRSDDSADIKPYTHKRQVEKIVVKLGEELQFFKTKFLRVLNVVVSRLFANNVLWLRDAERVSKCLLLSAREQFRTKCAAGQQPRHQMGPIEGDFAVAISLYHAYDLLLQHGLLPFYNFVTGIVDGSKGISRAKSELSRNPDFSGIIEDLRRQIELPPGQDDGNATTSSDVSLKAQNVKPSFVGHPKLISLRDIVLEHFRACESAEHAGGGKGSRVMIFSQFRDSVQEISRMLSRHAPLVKAMSFIGQQSKGNSSKGLTQKEQLEVIRKFRNGGYNTLVATCVGEEGLDIGEVDLIVCFDASASPIRLVQRMGRTGRKRAGRIIVLVTEGKEEQIYHRSQRNKSNIHKTILESARTLDLYLENPRMVPRSINPVCQKMFITVDATASKSKSKCATKSARKSTDGNIKKLLSACPRKDEGFLSPEKLRYWNDNFKLPCHEAGLTPSKSTSTRPQNRQSAGERCTQAVPALSLTEWTAWQTPLQQFHYVDHSKRSRHFAEILEFCDFRRDCGDGEDNYELEMQSFLNREDIVGPGNGKVGSSEVVLGDEGSERNKGKKESEKKGKEVLVLSEDDEEMAREEDVVADKGNGASRKRKSTNFDSDLDDDFDEDAKIYQDRSHGNTSFSRRKSSPSNSTSEVRSSKKNQSEPPKLLIKNQSKSNRESNQPTVENIPHDQSEGASSHDEVFPVFPLDCNDRELASGNDLSGLLDIPSSQKQHKHRSRVTEALPEAPSLDTLLDLSALNVGGNSLLEPPLQEVLDIFQESEDEDLLITQTPKTSKGHDGLKDEEKNGGAIELDFREEIGNFLEDNEIDRALCDVQTPCLFDDEEFENRTNRSVEKTLRRTAEDRGPHNGKNDEFLENNIDFLEDSHLETEEDLVNVDDKEIPSSSARLKKGLTDVKRINGFSNFSSSDSNETGERLGISKPFCGKSIDESLVAGRSQKKPLLEHNVARMKPSRQNESDPHINEYSLNKIRLFHFAQTTADQDKSSDVLTSDEDDFDVVAPSPLRGNFRSSFSGKVGTGMSRSFKAKRMQTGCSQKGENEMKSSRNKTLKLKCTNKQVNEEVKLRQEGQLLNLKCSPFKNDFSFDTSKNVEKEMSQLSRVKEGKLNRKEKMTATISPQVVKDSFSNETKSETHRNSTDSSGFNRRLSANEQDKITLHQPPVAHSVCTNIDSPEHTRNDNEDLSCLSPTIETSSQFLRKKKANVCSKDHKDDFQLPSKISSLKASPHTVRKSFGEQKKGSPYNEVLTPRREDLLESENDSPLVVKRKRSLRSLHFRNELCDEDGSAGEKREYEDDFQDEASVVYCDGSNKRKSVKNGTTDVHTISDSEDEFEEQERITRKRKLPVQGQPKNKIFKKRRPILDNFLDDEAEVSADGEMNSSEHEESLSAEDMDDSFIDDRSQLTQRSPLTAMKKKTRDTSVNMMDVYRLSLLTPHRKQFRFQTPAFHRFKNRYKMVYNQLPATQNTSRSPTDDDDDDHQDVSMETQESEEDDVAAGPPTVSPDESQIVVRRHRRGRRRVLADSFATSPEAPSSDSKHHTNISPPKNSLRTDPPRGPRVAVKDADSKHPPKLCPDDTIFKHPPKSCKDDTIFKHPPKSCKDDTIFKHPPKSCKDDTIFKHPPKFCKDDTIFKHPGNIAPVSMNRGANRTQRVSNGHSNDENIEDILAALEDSDESFMMEISASPKENSLKKHDVTSETRLPPKNCARKTLDYSLSNSSRGKINANSEEAERTCVGNSTNVSPLFPPLSTSTSSKDPTSFTHARQEKTTDLTSCPEQMGIFDTAREPEKPARPSNATSPALTAAERDKNKVTILVCSKEVSNCQIVSLLRRKHNIKAVVSQITGCDYIVSTRMAVERKCVSEISNQANFNKLTRRVQELCDLYDRPCVVIEKDRVKNGETQVKYEVRSKYYDRILACLAQTHIKVFFSDGQEGTSDVLASLAQLEESKKHGIIYPLPLSKDREQIVKFLSSIPRTSYITAISLCYHHQTLQQLMNSSAEDLVKRVRNLSLKRAKDILQFLQHGFCADVTGCGNT